MNSLELVNDRRITSDDVIDALVNLKQLVFEVTDACNLKCKYCAYGDLYFGYDKREDSFLNVEKGIAVIDYLSSIWRTHKTSASNPVTFISFYGGEPLMNMDFIATIVDYIHSNKYNRSIVFSMTTNGLLLDRYIDFLVKENFNILVSLDGDCQSNGHRLTKSGNSSFERVYNNIRMIRNKFPSFFQNHVSFNSVLHNLNSVESVYKFFHDEFDKETTISELNTSNIREDRQNEFLAIFKNKTDSIAESKQSDVLAKQLFIGNPQTHDLLLFLHQHSGNVYKNYNDLFVNYKHHHFCPTGTCLPFGKKMFVTVNGKILQCEKISQRYSLGYINDSNEVIMPIEAIVSSFNSLLDKMQSQCSFCFKKKSCIQCVYYISDIDKAHPKCQGFMNEKTFNEHTANCLAYLYKNPGLYKKLLEDIVID